MIPGYRTYENSIQRSEGAPIHIVLLQVFLHIIMISFYDTQCCRLAFLIQQDVHS